MTTLRYELASRGANGEWVLIGDFGARDRAIRFAKALAPSLHHDDSGIVVLGMSNHLGSGRYGDRVGLTPDVDGTYRLIDPLP